MEIVRFRIKGLAPLLMHNPRAMGNGGGAQDEGAMRGKKVYDTVQEAKESAYTFPDGSLAFPAVGVRSGLLNASKGYSVKMDGSSKRTALRPRLAGALLVMDEYFPLVDIEGVPLREYVLDQRRVMVQKAGVVRTRAKVEDWRLDCAFQYIQALAPPQALINMIEEAGQRIGLGDYRPERMGWFGRYELDGDVEVETI